jgi:hypothetical protein
MVRFYKSYLGRLLLGMLILIELERTSGKEGVATIIAGYKGTEVDAGAVRNALDLYLNAYPDESPANDDVLKGALGQLNKKKSDDLDLLDVVVSALRLPFANYLNGGSLKILRDAILTPGELTGLRKAFKAGSKCACGHEFSSQEMLSASIQGENIILHCTACSRPAYVRCDHCQELVLITGKTATTWRNEVDCGCRKRAEAQATLAATPGVTPTDLRTLRHIQNVARRATIREAAPTLQPPQACAQAANMITFYDGGTIAPPDDLEDEL